MRVDAVTLPDLQAAAPQVAIVPVGAFEQHGAHLPYATDSLIAQALARALAERLPALVLPVLPFSCSHEHAGFPYAVSLGSQTLIAVINDIVRSLERSGVVLTVLLNAHGGNYVLGNVVQELNQDRLRVVMVPTRQQWQQAIAQAGLTTNPSADMHGGELETSLLLATQPDVVRPELAHDHEATERPWLTVLGMRHYTPTGIIGRPSQASAAKGQRLLAGLADAMAHDLATFVKIKG